MSIYEKHLRSKYPAEAQPPHVEGAVYTVLMIEHDDPDNDPRAWDWGLIDFGAVTDRPVLVRTVGHWNIGASPWHQPEAMMVHRPKYAGRRETRGRLDR